MIWNYRLPEDGWLNIEITYGAAEVVSGSTFKIVSVGNEVSGTVENTGGYYSCKTKIIGKIHLQENSSLNL